MHDWVLCECPYYEIIDDKLSIYKDWLYMTFVGPPFTDNENWSFHPIQTLFDISTYKNICDPIFEGDFKSIFYGIVRFIPRLFKRFHPKPFDKIFICFSISIPISIIIFIISMVLFDSNDDNSSKKKNKKQKKNSQKSNKGKKNVESSKSIPNKEPSLYDSPYFSDFHYPILCNDQQENDSILSNIYVVPKSLNKILGGSITIQTMSKLVNDELRKYNLYNGNDFTIRCPVDLGLFSVNHPNSLFNLVKTKKIKVIEFSSSPFIITVKNITNNKIVIRLSKGSIIESIAIKEPCIVTEDWSTVIKPNETITAEFQCSVRNNETPNGKCLITPFVLNANENQINNYWNEIKNVILASEIVPTNLNENINEEKDKNHEQNEEPQNKKSNADKRKKKKPSKNAQVEKKIKKKDA